MGVKVQKTMLSYILKEHGEGKILTAAKKIGVSPDYLYKVVNHDIPVGDRFIKGLMKLTGLDFSALFYYSEKED